MHAPLGSDRCVRVDTLNHVSGSNDGDIGADSLDFLLTDPLSAQTLALRVGISTGGGYIDEAFDLWGILDSLGHGNGDADVSLLKVLLLSVEDMRANARNDNIRRLHGKSHLFFIGHILQLDVGFVSKISRSFDLLEPIVPLTCHLTVW